MLIIFTIAIFCSNNIYATNENQTGNETDLTNNSANSSNITEDNNTNSELTYQAAGENFTNIRGFWISTDVNNLDVNALQNANVTDVFVKTNLISNPTYSTTLNTVIQKLTGTGIRIHAWITCFKDADGNWINPANTTQRTFLLDKIKDIARNYNIDGIHLDYVRYPGTAYNYSNGTETITSFVEDVYDAVKGIKAKLMISAAVMPECGQNAYYYGQDYTKLAPYLDFLVPMIYKGNYNADTSWIGTTTAYIVAHSNGTPVVSGLQTYRSDSNVTPIPSDELKYDISSALSNGSSGYVLFRYGLVDNNFFNLTYFTIGQITDAAASLNAYVERYYTLPANVTINGTTMNMAQFLELMMTATQQINNKNNNPILLRTFNLPTNPLDDIKSGNIQIAEYLKIANDLKTYMDSTGKTPDYQYQTSLGTHLGFQNLVYMYSFILYVNKVGNYLLNFVPMKPWSSIGGQSAGIIPNGPTFTIDQIKDTATTIRNYVESKNKLPDNITINGTTMNMAQFLELMMTATLQLNSGNNNPIPLRTYNLPNNPLDDIKSGNIQIAEYLKIANDLKIYMDSTGKTPDYQYQTSLGTHLG
ncbi:MAG: glycosyl hydrolase family 18 protein, partial [Methanobacterium sp.]